MRTSGTAFLLVMQNYPGGITLFHGVVHRTPLTQNIKRCLATQKESCRIMESIHAVPLVLFQDLTSFSRSPTCQATEQTV